MSETARPIAIFRTTRPAVRLAGFIATVLAFTAVYTLKAQAQDLTQAAPEVQTVAPRAHAIPAGSGRSFTEASVFAAPGLECKVYPVGGNSARAVRVYTDSDGFARFYALRAAAGDKTRALTMDCVDAKGKPSTYPVDLTADETFVPRPLDLESEPGIDRPALTGDPLAYPQSELIQAGYGLRPDPATSPEAYQRWLNSATRPARMLTSKRPRPATQKVNQTASPYWTGTAITGKQSYISVEGNISVPKVIANGDETGYDVGDNDVHVAVWNGLGGFGTGSGLIQGGYQIDVDESVLSFDTFREYCCGNPNSNGYKGDFSPKSGDTVYSEEWYCDKNGNLSLNGGYGCTYLHDTTSGAVLNCVSPTSKTCWSVPALPLCSVNPKASGCETIGEAAEFVIELQGPAWPDLGNEVTLTGSAYSSQTKSYSQTVNNDPTLNMLNDFTGQSSPSHMNVSIGSASQTYFNVSQFAKVSGTADNAAGAQTIAVGSNGNKSSIGDPWMLGKSANSNGDHSVYHWVNGAWVQMPNGAAGTQIAIGKDLYPWLANNAGSLFYWNGSSWQNAPGYPGLCASHVAVGPKSTGDPYGTPWTLGCHGNSNGDRTIYELVNGSWQQMPGAGIVIADGPNGFPWLANKAGSLFYWNGVSWQNAPANPCATSVAVGPINDGLFLEYPWGDAWILGCTKGSNGYSIYQYQLQSNSWVQIPGSALQISVSPDLGVPWIVDANGNIYE